MRGQWLLALTGMLAMTIAAHGDTTPQVTLAVPGSAGPSAGAIERFTLRFSHPMVPLGDPRATPAAASDCPVPSTGRWVDQQTFVLDFDHALPGGISCAVTLRDDIATLQGVRLSGRHSFPIDTGGPSVRAVFAPGLDGYIDEDQVFLVATDVPADRRSVASHAACAVEGIGETIAVDVLGADVPEKIIRESGNSNWRLIWFLEQAGLPQTLPDDPKARQSALANLMALSCRRPLPPEHRAALVWPGSVADKSGKKAGRDQRFDFKVRTAFNARFECGRVNSRAACDPIRPVHVRFSAPIPRDQALAVRLRLADGSERTPTVDDRDKNDSDLSDLEFSGPFPAQSEATVLLPSGVKDISGRPLANAERFPLAVRFDVMPPLVKFAANFGILEAQEGGILPVTVRAVEPSLAGNLKSIGGRSERIANDDAAIAAMLRKLDDAERSDFEYVEQPDGTRKAVNHTREKPLLGADATALSVGLPGKGKDFEVVGIPLKKPGFYVVELASPALGKALLGRNTPRYVAAGALVTNMSVHFKWGHESSLVWVTALDSGEPVRGAAISVIDSCTGTRQAEGITDASGRLLLTGGLPEPSPYASCGRGYEDHPLMVSARLDGDMSFTLSSWSKGILPYDFELPYGWQPPQDIIHTVFDRALVRVGETVHMKHVLRHPVGAGFAFAKGFKGTLRLVHLGSDTRFEMPVTIDARGVGDSSWTVPQGAPLGDYDLRFEVDGKTIWTEQSVRVDEYRLPTMRASVTGPAQPLVRPSGVPLNLYVGYLSGGGAGRLGVTLRTDFNSAVPTPQGWDDFRFGGDEVKEGTHPLDDRGEAETAPLPFSQTLPATLGSDGTAKAHVDVNQPVTKPIGMTVEMDYPDANGEALTASRHLTLYPAALQVGVKTDGWLMRNTDLRLQFVVLDLEGKPIAGQAVKVALYSREIVTVRRRLIGGFYAYDNQEKVTRIGASCSARSDKLGRAHCALDPGISGQVTVVATVTDSEGRETRAVRTVWLAGDNDWWFGGDNGDRMDVIPEQNSYKAGETARFQVRMPFRSATALVTVEREGILSSFVTRLSGKDPVVEVKMPGAYAPDVYVSVMAVRGRVSGWRLWLADLARKWHLPWLSRDGAYPTALVDLAKPSYRIGIAKVNVGWEGHRLAVEVKAGKARYAVRDTANVSIAVHGPDGKPARSADVAFVAVDEALLQLMPNPSWDVLSAMMGQRPLGVVTSTAQMQVVGKRHYGKKAVAAGGGGGDASAINREDFQPVLLWKGHVELDAQGRAQVAVPLSDALSTFKLVAIATNGAQLFGTGETSIRTTQNLAIYAGLPPVVRTGDWYGATFTLRNGSGHVMTAVATPKIEPAAANVRPLSVTIPAGGAATVRWNLHAPGEPGPLKWTVKARSADGRDADAVVTTQQVAPAFPIEVWAASLLRVGDDAMPAIKAPAGALPGGSVNIALSNSLAPPLDGVRDYMGNYYYDCFEQRLSRLIATGNDGEWTALAAAIPTYLDADGLLRYWPRAELRGSPELTAYVIAVTSAAGLPIPDEQRQRMIAGLRNVVTGRLRQDRPFSSADERLVRIAALSALARAGAADPALIATVDMAPADMPTGTLADWIVALDKVPSAARAADMRSAAEYELRKRLVYEGTRLDLADQTRAPWWMMVSSDEMAIKALDAVLGKSGWAQDVPKMMVGVAQRQWHGHWDTTPANAWGTLIARRFSGLYPADAVTGTTKATLGGVTRTASWPRPSDAAPLSLPLTAGNLSLSQSGGAGPWATVSVHAAVPLAKPLMAGYRVEKRIVPISRKVKGRWSVGDVVKVQIAVEASAERNWVVVNDPIPPGSSIIGDMANQSQILAKQAQAGPGVKFGAVDADGKLWEVQAGVLPAYIERRQDSWRGYFDWVPRGRFVTEYVLRINSPGRFALPPTRVEAMYSPEIRAQLPNAPMTIWQR